MDRAAAQDKSMRNGSRVSWIEGWETTEVGSAYLFEKPQSRVRKMPRFPDSIDCISNDYNYCNSSIYSTNRDCSELSNNDNSTYYTNNSYYKPKRADNNQYNNNT